MCECYSNGPEYCNIHKEMNISLNRLEKIADNYFSNYRDNGEYLE